MVLSQVEQISGSHLEDALRVDIARRMSPVGPPPRAPGPPGRALRATRHIVRSVAREFPVLRRASGRAVPFFWSLLRQTFEGTPIPAMRLLLRGIELAPPLRIGSRKHDQTFAVGTDFQGRIAIDVEQFQNRTVDDQSQAVSVFGESLYHGDTPYLQCITNNPRKTLGHR